MSLVKDIVLVGGGTAIGVVGLVWLLRKRDGSGEGWSIFGGHGGDSLFGGPESGPLEEDGGDGGRGKEPGKGEGKGQGSAGKDGKSQDSGNGKSGKSGSGSSGSDGKDEGKTKEGSGKGGDGTGGKGGGSGGGVGSGQGSGTQHGQDDESGHGETEGGGGDNHVFDPYAGWGGNMIEGDLPAPDLSEGKLEAVGTTIYNLVGNVVTATDLPPPLHQYDPNLGIDLTFWADVALHKNYTLPPGRLDPTIKSHVPWIELWVFILDLVIRAEAELNEGLDDIIDEDWVGPWIPFPDDVPAEE